MNTSSARSSKKTTDAPWTPRAGAVSKAGFLYLLGGERGCTCGFDPASPCQPATATLYFNDAWLSWDGASWELVTSAAAWSPRPGHQCVVLLDPIVWFGGYGEVPGLPPVPTNPADMSIDMDALVMSGGRRGLRPSIMTFGGDRERSGLPSDVNKFLIENDVWRLSAPGPTSARP